MSELKNSNPQKHLDLLLSKYSQIKDEQEYKRKKQETDAIYKTDSRLLNMSSGKGYPYNSQKHKNSYYV